MASTRTVSEIINAATVTDAFDWAKTREQFTFCIDFLEISAHSPRADHWVDQLELVFEGLLAEAAAEGSEAPGFDSPSKNDEYFRP